MATSAQKSIELNLSVMPKNTKKAFNFLSTQNWLKDSGWYLAGGTALALTAGHRTSVDLDFFTTQKNFEAAEILEHFKDNGDWQTDIGKQSTIYGKLFEAKISFIAYPFFVPKQEFLRYGAISILQPIDIAVMKIIAISQRGRKRDFFDLYWLIKHFEPLGETLKRLKIQYPSVAHDYHHILKSLAYFEDAENDPAPILHFEMTWKEVKGFFTHEIPALTEKVIGLS